MSISLCEFAKNHTALFVCTAGLAYVGFLGYRVVTWVLKRCGLMDRVDKVVQPVLNAKATSSQTPTESARSIKVQTPTQSVTSASSAVPSAALAQSVLNQLPPSQSPTPTTPAVSVTLILSQPITDAANQTSDEISSQQGAKSATTLVPVFSADFFRSELDQLPPSQSATPTTNPMRDFTRVMQKTFSVQTSLTEAERIIIKEYRTDFLKEFSEYTTADQRELCIRNMPKFYESYRSWESFENVTKLREGMPALLSDKQIALLNGAGLLFNALDSGWIELGTGIFEKPSEYGLFSMIFSNLDVMNYLLTPDFAKKVPSKDDRMTLLTHLFKHHAKFFPQRTVESWKYNTDYSHLIKAASSDIPEALMILLTNVVFLDDKEYRDLMKCLDTNQAFKELGDVKQTQLISHLKIKGGR